MSRLAIYAIAVAGIAVASGMAGREWSERKWQAKWSKSEAAQQAALALEQAKNRQIEHAWQEIVDLERGKLDDAKRQIGQRDADLARLRIDTRGLRDQLAEFAAGRGAEDSLAACRQEAGALAEATARGGEILAEGQDLLRRFAGAHDARAEEVRALIDSWPR